MLFIRYILYLSEIIDFIKIGGQSFTGDLYDKTLLKISYVKDKLIFDDFLSTTEVYINPYIKYLLINRFKKIINDIKTEFKK